MSRRAALAYEINHPNAHGVEIMRCELNSEHWHVRSKSGCFMNKDNGAFRNCPGNMIPYTFTDASKAEKAWIKFHGDMEPKTIVIGPACERCVQ